VNCFKKIDELFCDLRGFTGPEIADAEDVMALLGRAIP
jgi:hypothetical protein